ncbi:uncharacterized protein LOC100376102 [Saccoglossus kowalevskii]|uniref:Uncharacterized protein LOC100376102 n=1 Tax=Saccoglossus kowalevskii TaxID=10224 RepID=A0ABM0GLY0_SACKO|nr:PREDICTED: uncharacterized protein LOC100376102 [Saccoglossus kowalevskii]
MYLGIQVYSGGCNEHIVPFLYLAARCFLLCVFAVNVESTTTVSTPTTYPTVASENVTDFVENSTLIVNSTTTTVTKQHTDDKLRPVDVVTIVVCVCVFGFVFFVVVGVLTYLHYKIGKARRVSSASVASHYPPP